MTSTCIVQVCESNKDFQLNERTYNWKLERATKVTGRLGYSLPSVRSSVAAVIRSFVLTNLRTFPLGLGPAADMHIITYKNRISNKPKKTYRCLLQICSRYGKYQALLYCYRSPLFIKPGKKNSKVCGSS